MREQWSLPGFEVDELLGSGASGQVWRAREIATGQTVALKRLRPGADPSAVEALRREAAVLRALDSPFVLRLRAVVGQGAQAVLVLDHAEGGSLAALLDRRGRLEPGELVTVAAPLAQALAEAHARGLVHGDLSPANVLFTGDGMPLLADLGVSRTAGERRAAVDGTAEYVDPVVARGGAPDAAADVWALGAVCHHVLAGDPPHEGGSATQVLHAAATGARAPLGLLAPHVSRALVAVVERALDPDPAGRPTATEFAAALHRVQAAAPVRLAPAVRGPAGGGPPGGGPAGGSADGGGEAPRATDVVRRPPAPPASPARRERPQLAVVLSLSLLAVLLGGGLAWALSGAGPAPLPALAAGAAPEGAGTAPERAGHDRAELRRPAATTAGPSRSSPSAPGASGSAAPPATAPPATASAVTAPPATASLPSASPGTVPPGTAPAVTAPPATAFPPTASTGTAPPPTAAAGPAAPSRPAADPDWTGELQRLDRDREEAFSRGDPGRLDRVYVAGSAVARADLARLRELTSRGHTALGVRHVVRRVDRLSGGEDRVDLRVVDVLGPHTVVDASGAAVRRLPGRGPGSYDVQLRRQAGAWRIARVTTSG